MEKVSNLPTLSYPEAFVEEVKQVFAGKETEESLNKLSKDIINLAESNDYNLGVVLNDLYDETIEPEDVLKLINTGEKGIAELKEKALRIYKIKKLYSKWALLTETQLDSYAG